jgi:hypothetical protein
MMEPHIDVITLAVGDLDRSLAFDRDRASCVGLFVDELGGDDAGRVEAEADPCRARRDRLDDVTVERLTRLVNRHAAPI